jgi:hypothetical protein
MPRKAESKQGTMLFNPFGLEKISFNNSQKDVNIKLE